MAQLKAAPRRLSLPDGGMFELSGSRVTTIERADMLASGSECPILLPVLGGALAGAAVTYAIVRWLRR